MGFNLQAIRDLNKVVVFSTKNEEDKVVLYTDKGWDFEFKVNMDEVFGGAVNLIKSPIARSLIGHTLGVSTVLDISRKYAFTGTDPIKANIPCYLVLEENPNQDIIAPLNKLLRLILPTRGQSASSILTIPGADANKSLKESIRSADIWSALNAMKNAILSYSGDIYTLEVPDSFKAENSHTLSITWGGHTFDDVFITSIHVSTDKFLYAYGSGTARKPIPDFVKVDLYFETSRIVALPNGKHDYFPQI